MNTTALELASKPQPLPPMKILIVIEGLGLSSFRNVHSFQLGAHVGEYRPVGRCRHFNLALT